MDENNAKRRDELERAHYNPNQLHLSELTRYGFFSRRLFAVYLGCEA